jgi:hypothetical protein
MIRLPSIVKLLLLAACVSAATFGDPLASDEPEDAPIVESRIDFYDLTFKTNEGKPFSLREYAEGKRVVIVSFVAGWCPNSNRNGHVLKRLYDRYRDRGLGAVAVMEYTDAEELRIHINRIGIDYPVIVETSKRDARKKSAHYRYRQSVGDKRKWGTPFYVIIDARDLEPAAAGSPLTRRVYTVSGEIIEEEAERFLNDRLTPR